jgi:hypothetical protein
MNSGLKILEPIAVYLCRSRLQLTSKFCDELVSSAYLGWVSVMSKFFLIYYYRPDINYELL